MSRWTSIALIALVWIPSLRPQEKPPAAAAGSRPERLAALQKEHDDAKKAFMTAYQAAKTPEEREKLQYPDAKTWTPRVWDLVREDPRDETACGALCWIVQMNPSKQDLQDAIAAILKDHLKSPKIGDVCQSLGGNVQIDSKVLERIAAENPDRNVKGQALYALASHRLESASTAKSIATSSGEDAKGLKDYVGEERFAELKVFDAAKAEKEAAEILDRVVKDFADVKGGHSTLGEAAQGDLHELRDLVVGKVAPDIEAEDLAGTKFKLSDYRGKVVLLDFWGNW